MISSDDLFQWEQDAVGGIDTRENQRIGSLCAEVRRLQHEINDPNYQYVGRIHRHAIICRNGEIDRLRKENGELRDRLVSLTQASNTVGEAPQE